MVLIGEWVGRFRFLNFCIVYTKQLVGNELLVTLTEKDDYNNAYIP